MFEREVEAFITRNNLFTKEDKILAGVSGGADSMAMALTLKILGYNFAIAHCDFKLRGPESDADREYVKEWAKKNCIEFHTISFDTTQEAAKNGESIQIAARRLRYNWFEELCQCHGYTKIAIAHNQDDTIETFFINMLRGTGIRGFMGIAAKAGQIARPLLAMPRYRIEEYVEQKALAYRTDSTNLSDKYLRNNLRHNIIPLLKNISPAFAETMVSNMENAERTVEYMDIITDIISSNAMDGCTINLSLLQAYGHARTTILYEIIKKQGFNFSDARSIIDCYDAHKSGRKFLCSNYIALLNRDHLIVEPIKPSNNSEAKWLNSGESVQYMDKIFSVKIVDRTQIKSLKVAPNTLLADSAKLEFPLCLTTVAKGDSFVALGMKGRKKVSDILIDQKLSLTQKSKQVVVRSKEDILWLVGVRVAEKFKISDQTLHVAIITYIDIT